MATVMTLVPTVTTVLPSALLDVKALARASAHMRRQLPLQPFTRLLDNAVLAVNPQSPDLQPLQVDIQFSFDEFYRPCVRGHAQMSLPMICQRCLQPIVQLLLIPIHLILTQEIDDKPYAEDLELLPIGEGELTWIELLEDDLLLALPMVPKHDVGACQPIGLVFSESGVDQVDAIPVEPKKPNPFLVLKGGHE